MPTLSKIAAAVAAAGLLAPVALAQGLTGDVGVNVGVGVQTSRGTTTVEAGGGVSGSAGADNEVRLENQSEVAAQVQALLQVAERSQGGVGPEVREIAQAYASSSGRASEARARVEGRPGWLTFIIGSDYGNLGKLRSELATTENQIQRLTSAVDRAFDPAVKASLQLQIDVLEAQASATAEFVAENESQFSVFGWFFKLFS